MYTIEIDGNVCYAPNLAYRGYAVINPVHTAEINKADTLTFTVPPNNPLYGSIQPLTSDVTLRWDGEILCHGRVLNRDRDFQNRKKLTCEGALAWLNDSIIPPHTRTASVSSYVSYILGLHNAQVEANRQLQVGTISDVDVEDLEPGATIPYDVDAIARQVIAGQWGVGTDRRQRLEAAGYSYELIQNKVNELLGVSYRYTVETTQSASSAGTLEIEVTDYTTALSCLTAEWLSEQGYTIRARSVDENGGIVTYIDLLSRNGVMGEQTVQFARNLLDLDEQLDASDIYTCVIPLGKATDGVPLTIASINAGQIYLENTDLSALYGKIYRTINHSDIADANELLAAGRNDVKECLSGSLSLNVKAVDLAFAGDETDRFFVGGYNRILSIPHSYDDYLMCTKIQTYLQDAGKTNYTFGSTRKGLTEKI